MKGLVFIGILFLFSSCSEPSTNPRDGELSGSLVDSVEGFPKFRGKNIFLKASGVEVKNFSFDQKNWSIKSKTMFSCMGEHYFVENTEYCFYFDRLWIQSKLSSQQNSKFFALDAKAAFSNKIFSDFLFQDTILTIEGTDFVLFSNVINWQKMKNLLISPATSKHIMKNRAGDVLHGKNLVLDYRSNIFSMEQVELNLVEDL